MKIESIKYSEEFHGTLEAGVARAQEIARIYQPAFGVQVEIDGEIIWDSEEDQ